MLWNTEGGSPMVPVGEADLPTPLAVRPKSCSKTQTKTLSKATACLHAHWPAPSRARSAPVKRHWRFAALPLVQGSTAPSHLAQQREPGQRARVFQGGFYLDLHLMLDISSGSQVGDCLSCKWKRAGSKRGF
jgi:hypothetical protein